MFTRRPIFKPQVLPLSGIVGLFLVLGIIYLWFIPPFEGPDEAQHFAYMKWLITEGNLPPQGAAAWETGVEQESGQPPFYYFIASLPARFVDITNPAAIYRPNPHFIGPLPRSDFDNDNRAIHYPSDTQPLRGGWLALYLARAVTLGFGVVLIVTVYGLVRQIWPEPRFIALGAAFLVAVTPQVLYISSMVSNDIPAAALSTLALWLFAFYLHQYETRSPLWGLIVGLILGLAGLTKVSAFTLSLPIGLGLAWLWLSGRRSLGQTVQFGLAFTGGILVSSGWWLGHNWLTQGSPFGLNPHDQTSWAIGPNDKIDPFILRWQDVWRSYWLALGWGSIRLGEWPGGWPYTILFGALFLALGGWLRSLWLWWQHAEKRPPATTLLLLGLLFIGLIITAISLESWMHRVIAPFGRLLFPLIGGISLFLVLGWRQLHPRLPLLVYAYVAALGILTPFILIHPAYNHTTLTTAEMALLPSPIGWQFGTTATSPLAELISFTPEQLTSYAGEIMPITLCWRALASAEQDYTVMVQVLGAENRLIATRRSFPGEGRYPTSLWQPGQVWCEKIHILIPSDLPETLAYRLEIGMLNEENGYRLVVTDKQGNLLPHTFVEVVRLVQPATQRFIADLPMTPDLHLVDSQHASIWQIGATVPLTLTWAATTPVGADYQVFIHLRDLQTDENIMNGDGPPVGGLYPTSWWAANELITDVHTIFLPPELVPGNYRLVVGLYDLVTGQHPLPEIDLGLIRVEP